MVPVYFQAKQNSWLTANNGTFQQKAKEKGFLATGLLLVLDMHYEGVKWQKLPESQQNL